MCFNDNNQKKTLSQTANAICCMLCVASCALTAEPATSGLSAAPQDRVNAALDPDGRAFTVTAPGTKGFRGGFSVIVLIGGRTQELSSAAGSLVAPAAQTTEDTPYGQAVVTAVTMRFAEEQIGLLFRLGQVPGVPGVLAQAGIRNDGTESINLVSVMPAVLEGQVKDDPSEWLVTQLDKSVEYAPPVVALGEISQPLYVYEYGGFYRKDGVGFLFGPVGTPIAYVDARITHRGEGKVSFHYRADMSNVRVAPGETRWGQQVVLLMEPPQTALARWAEWVGKTHTARTSKGALSGWGSWYYLHSRVSGQDVLAVADEVANSPARLRPDVIQIDFGYTAPSRQMDANEKFPEGLAYYARSIADTGASPGLCIISGSWSEAVRLAAEAKRNGFNYLKSYVPFRKFPSGTETRETLFESMRKGYAMLRETAGENTYLLSCVKAPNRAAVGFTDACRTGSEAERDKLRFVIDDVLRSYMLNGRWFAVDNDAYYMGADVKNISEIKGGWPLVRTWASMVGLSCGAAFTSDPWHWESFKPYWRNVETMTPPAKERTEVLDLCTSPEWPRLAGHVARPWGDWTVALLWNPGTTEQSITLDFAQAGMDPKRRYSVWSFWDNRYLGVAQGSWVTPRLAPSASQHLSFTPLDHHPSRPVLIGSDLHIYCGAAELKCVTSRRGAMTIELTDAGAREGDLFIYSRYQPILRTAEGCVVSGIGSGGENVWRISLRERQRGNLQRIEMAILLPVSQQVWFWLLIAVLAGSLLFAAWRYVVGARAQLALARLERQTIRQQERARIARDIHDDLGASLTQIALMLEREEDVPEANRDRPRWQRIAGKARASVHALNEIVWAVNPDNDSLSKLVDFVYSFSEEICQSAGLRCFHDVPVLLPVRVLTSEFRHSLFLAVKEALNNVIKHAHATEVRLRVSWAEDELQIEIADNGQGFDASQGRVLGNGLKNMQTRLSGLGGRAEIASQPGEGTKITFVVRSTSSG
jgi:signal transduction histidine kinase